MQKWSNLKDDMTFCSSRWGHELEQHIKTGHMFLDCQLERIVVDFEQKKIHLRQWFFGFNYISDVNGVLKSARVYVCVCPIDRWQYLYLT